MKKATSKHTFNEAIEVIRRLREGGASMETIAVHLNDLNYPTKTGRRFTPSIVRNVLVGWTLPAVV